MMTTSLSPYPSVLLYASREALSPAVVENFPRSGGDPTWSEGKGGEGEGSL